MAALFVVYMPKLYMVSSNLELPIRSFNPRIPKVQTLLCRPHWQHCHAITRRCHPHRTSPPRPRLSSHQGYDESNLLTIPDRSAENLVVRFHRVISPFHCKDSAIEMMINFIASDLVVAVAVSYNDATTCGSSLSDLHNDGDSTRSENLTVVGSGESVLSRHPLQVEQIL
jgi:hypothetical protein